LFLPFTLALSPQPYLTLFGRELCTSFLSTSSLLPLRSHHGSLFPYHLHNACGYLAFDSTSSSLLGWLQPDGLGAGPRKWVEVLPAAQLVPGLLVSLQHVPCGAYFFLSLLPVW
jgi:hypothetical protein